MASVTSLRNARSTDLHNPSRWWATLPDDFCRSPDGTELDGKYPLRIRGSAAIDHVLRSFLGTSISGAMAPMYLSRERFDAQLAMMDFYRELSDLGDADKVFSAPRPNQRVTARRRPALKFRPGGLTPMELSFTSRFETLHPDMQKPYTAHRANRRAVAEYWAHPGGPRKTLIVTHGYMISARLINSWLFSLNWFYENGYDILLYTLPFHGSRAERSDPYSGFGYFSGGLPQTNEAMAQAVHDLRVFMDWLQARGVPAMGATGISLGGYITALLANADSRLSFAIPNSPVVSPVDLFLEWLPTRWFTRPLLKRSGVGVPELRHAMAVHNPLSYHPKVNGRRLLIIAGSGDRITPPRHTHLLHAHWPKSHLHWFPGNHMIHLHADRYLEFMKHFMDLHTDPD